MPPIISTIKPDGSGDYTTLQAWDNATASSPDEHWAECYSGGGLGGWVQAARPNFTPTDESYIRVYAAEGHQHEFKIPANWNDVALLDGFVSIDNRTLIEGMYIHALGKAWQPKTSADIVRAHNLVIHGTMEDGDSSSGGSVMEFDNGNHALLEYHNCVIFGDGVDSTSTGTMVMAFLRTNGAHIDFAHLTIIDNIDPALTDGHIAFRIRADGVITGRLHNCFMYGSSNDFGTQGAGENHQYAVSHNASTNTTAPGSSSLHNLVLADQFVDPFSDWNLLETADLVDAADSSILGLDDIGAAQFAASEATIDAETASLTLTPRPASVLKTAILFASLATLTLTPNAAAMQVQRVLQQSAPATLSLTANDAELVRSRVITAEPATLSLTPRDAAMLRTARIDAQPASLTLTAQPAMMLRSLRIDAQPAALSLIGLDAVLEAGGVATINAERATLNLTSLDAEFVRQYIINAEPALMSLVGLDAQMVAPGKPGIVCGVLTETTLYSASLDEREIYSGAISEVAQYSASLTEETCGG